MVKKSRKLKVSVDFKNLNLTTVKDEYLIRVIDILIDGVAKH